jgi:Acyltransferase family
MPGVHVPLSNLRAVVILIVVAFHAVLPYLASQPAEPFAFDAAPYRWVAFPIIDRERFFGFDLFCAWQDVSLMTLMFFLAGVFTAPSLSRKGPFVYLSDRALRIGVPFAFAAAILAPLAYFASFSVTAADPSLEAFLRHWLALPLWPAGPAWFLWQLAVLTAIAAALQALAPEGLDALSRFVGTLGDHAPAFFATLIAVTILAYVPLALAFSAWDWASFGPFSVQLSRPLVYLVYFFTGFALGRHGLDRGLLRGDGALSQHWLLLLAAAIASFAAWGLLTALTLPDWNASPFIYRLAAALSFPPACASGVLCLLAIALRLLNFRDRVLDHLSASAYSIYLLHYAAVVWLQYILLAVALSAVAKGMIVFTLALGSSLAASTGLRSLVPLLPNLVGKRAVADQGR